MRLTVKLERAGQLRFVVMRADDFESSVKIVKGVKKIKWGSGAMWTVLGTELFMN